MRKDRTSCIHLTCSSCLIKVLPINTPPHLPLEHWNSLSRRTVTKTRADGHTSPLQIIMHLLIRMEQFGDLLWKNIGYKIFGGLLTCYSLVEPPLLYWNTMYIQRNSVKRNIIPANLWNRLRIQSAIIVVWMCEEYCYSECGGVLYSGSWRCVKPLATAHTQLSHAGNG